MNRKYLNAKYIEHPKKLTEEERRKNRTEASNRYNKANYKQLKANVRPDIYNAVDNYCNNNNVSKAQLITAACLYIIENNIDISEYTHKTTQDTE